MTMGRPRAFDPDEALNLALEVFWRKGYEGASLHDLTEAMGINKPSLYAAFGNKEDLFRKALERYTREKIAYFADAEQAPTARGVAERLLFGAVDMLTDPAHPVGCLVTKGAITCGDEAPSIKELIDHIRVDYETRMHARLERAKQEGDLPADADVDHLTQFLTTLVQGMSHQVIHGATREQLHKVAETALLAWPARA
jgi:AcrR family transcriptional regulator